MKCKQATQRFDCVPLYLPLCVLNGPDSGIMQQALSTQPGIAAEISEVNCFQQSGKCFFSALNVAVADGNNVEICQVFAVGSVLLVFLAEFN